MPLTRFLVAADLHALEINCYSASVSFAPSGAGQRSIANRLFKGAKAAPLELEEALRRFQAPPQGGGSSSHPSSNSEWEIKSWKGGTAHIGVLAGSKGYALIRKQCTS